MSMSVSVLANQIKTELLKTTPSSGDSPKSMDESLSDFAEAIATAVINHITSNAGILIDSGVIQVAGSPSAQANTTPIIVPPGSIS